MDKYIITGAAGNLAKELVSKLQSLGKEIVAIDICKPPQGSNTNWHQIDVTDYQTLEKVIARFLPDCIIHMASLLSISSESNPSKAWKINADASINLLELSSKYKIRKFFFPSTVATYGGKLPDLLPEDYPQWPDNIYGVTKVAVERAGTYFSQSRGVDFRSVRLPIVISPYAPPGAVSAYASHSFLAAVSKKVFTFPVSSEVSLSCIHIKDVINGIIKLINSPAELLTRKVYNLHGFKASAGDIKNSITQYIPDFSATFEPKELEMKILSPQPGTFIDDSARNDWGWDPQYDLAATTLGFLNITT